jgi:hypothetical protein
MTNVQLPKFTDPPSFSPSHSSDGQEVNLPPGWLVEHAKTRWRRGPPDKTQNYKWCENNVQSRVESWTVLVTVAGFLGAFALDSVAEMESPPDNASIYQSIFFALQHYGLTIAASSLLFATVVLSAVLWNVARELSLDHFIKERMDSPGYKEALGENFEVGYGAWCVLKSFTEDSVLPFGINAVDLSGKLFVLGLSAYVLAICASVLTSIDEFYVAVPCCSILVVSSVFGLMCSMRMGINLS